ncbi:MAG: hypothetical protein QXK89_00650 [Candidatus Bathyarchaeia archaeon]
MLRIERPIKISQWLSTVRDDDGTLVIDDGIIVIRELAKIYEVVRTLFLFKNNYKSANKLLIEKDAPNLGKVNDSKT